MKLSGNTILITGGSSGIGLEMTKQFSALNNTVIICGRNKETLLEAQWQVPGIHIYTCDLALESDRLKLVAWLADNHPQLNVLINNAAIVHRENFTLDPNGYEKAVKEIETNLIAPIHLIHQLLPLLGTQPNAAIINITTGLVYTPRTLYPIYNSTKTALHSFTQVLREQIKPNPTEIIEVLFPVVNTPWHKGAAPKIAIQPKEAVEKMLKGIENKQTEIRVGAVQLLYFLQRLAPRFAFKKINQLQ
ncbi:SDR family NAD(P)-dependent oxidoreductase [Flavihumibacter sp. RY-1]|uniref:SDR family NAD(P)-dependent oxidoreductase n=1 Tax=Flavihumibacter fluminis TaxID=2909236 RepID=A0ABS9BLW6_9BACT|nr:SDR family NAD(P)-dependent oxidoreductase [Flavihumibacter fluminis]MCF1715631.1 SDR family NAD(P)-dependent oxidoreductase [Flavihumibacter fluminis]